MAYKKSELARIDSGLCRDCGNPRGESGTKIMCRKCADKSSKRVVAWKKKKRVEYRLANLCIECGSNKENPEGSRCNKCINRASKSQKKRAEARRKENPKIGLCILCSEKTIGKSLYCEKHWIDKLSKRYSINKLLLIKLKEQKFKCFYTNIDLIPGENAYIVDIEPCKKRKDLINDINNFVWCDKRIKNMKKGLTDFELSSICKLILENSKL